VTTTFLFCSAVLLLGLGADGFPLPCWLVFLVCFLMGVHSFRCRRHRNKGRELERVRARIASDLHDDIGASLSQIAVLTEVLWRQTEHEHPHLAQSLATIAQLSGETVDALSDIVWATNPQHDSLTNLVRRMRRFASEILPAAQIEFSFVAPPPETELHLEAELRRQLFLIFKESLNNLVRHARCTQAAIELQRADAHLWLQIRDNGRGFAVHQRSEGNGLLNLQRRAQTIGAELTIHSIPGGTTIRLHIPHGQTASAPEVQTVRSWRCQGAQWFRYAWQQSRTYLNRGVTARARRATLIVPLVNAKFSAARAARRRSL
jgi:signal transduction histidine kinase